MFDNCGGFLVLGLFALGFAKMISLAARNPGASKSLFSIFFKR